MLFLPFRRRFLLPLLASLLATACAVGPDYQKPKEQTPEKWQELPNPPQATMTPSRAWWKAFGDPTLDSLMQQALKNNLDLLTAEARIREARARESGTTANLLPEIDLTGSAEKRHSGSLSSSGSLVTSTGTTTLRSSGGGSSELYETGFDASWEIDLFGGLRRQREAAGAEREAVVFDRDAVRLSLVAEVARDYYQFRLNQAQYNLAQETAKAQEDTARITQARFKAGVEGGLELSRAEAILQSTRSQLPLFDAQAGTARYSLERLLALEPGALKEPLEKTADFPLLLPTLALDTPTDVLARRPDVKAAERRLAEATALQGAAIADLYPKISLSAFFGVQSAAAGKLFSSGNDNWSIGANLLEPLIDFGRIRANIDIADAKQEQAFLSYRGTVLTALQEVETTLLTYLRETSRREALQAAADASAQAYHIAQLQYSQGILSQLDVLDAERTLYTAQVELVQRQANVVFDLVALYKALGLQDSEKPTSQPATEEKSN